MKNWSFWHYLLIIIGILIIVYILSPSARKWSCGAVNRFKKVGSKCSNCDTKISGIITSSGQCIPADQVAYDGCMQDNASMKDGSDCKGCGNNPADSSIQGLSGDGVIVSGKCTALPDAFAGKICVPASAMVKPLAVSYKRILGSGKEYSYYKNDGSIVAQGQATPLDTEITKDDYVWAYLQTITSCPAGQVKV